MVPRPGGRDCLFGVLWLSLWRAAGSAFPRGEAARGPSPSQEPKPPRAAPGDLACRVSSASPAQQRPPVLWRLWSAPSFRAKKKGRLPDGGDGPLRLGCVVEPAYRRVHRLRRRVNRQTGDAETGRSLPRTGYGVEQSRLSAVAERQRRRDNQSDKPRHCGPLRRPPVAHRGLARRVAHRLVGVPDRQPEQSLQLGYDQSARASPRVSARVDALALADGGRRPEPARSELTMWGIGSAIRAALGPTHRSVMSVLPIECRVSVQTPLLLCPPRVSLGCLPLLSQARFRVTGRRPVRRYPCGRVELSCQRGVGCQVGPRRWRPTCGPAWAVGRVAWSASRPRRNSQRRARRTSARSRRSVGIASPCR